MRSTAASSARREVREPSKATTIVRARGGMPRMVRTPLSRNVGTNHNQCADNYGSRAIEVELLGLEQTLGQSVTDEVCRLERLSFCMMWARCVSAVRTEM